MVCTAPKKGITDLTPKRGFESLTTHYHYRQPLTCGCLFLPTYSCYLYLHNILYTKNFLKHIYTLSLRVYQISLNYFALGGNKHNYTYGIERYRNVISI